MLVSTRPQGRTGSVENAEGTSGVKALQCSTERLPQLSPQRISLPTLARPGVSTERACRLLPSQKGSEHGDFWTLRRQARPIAMRWRPGDGQIFHRAAEEKIALPLLLTVGRNHIDEGAAHAVPERWGDLPVREGIAKRDHVVHKEVLTYRLRYGHVGTAIRQ